MDGTLFLRITMQKFRQLIQPLIDPWKDALQDKYFSLKLFLAPALFFVYSRITQDLGAFVEARKGVRLKDNLLMYFPSADFSVPIFMLLYGSIVFIVLTHLNKPRVILRLIQMHFVVAVVRQLCILMFPLEAPHGIIVLQDVFLENTFYPQDAPLTKDLFFSGHVASIWIYFLCAQIRPVRVYMLFAALLMTFMVLSMRIHYTYDVYGAIIITTIIYFAPTRLRFYYTKVKGKYSYKTANID